MAFVGAEKFLGINGYLEGIGHSLDFGQTLLDLIITLGFFTMNRYKTVAKTRNFLNIGL